MDVFCGLDKRVGIKRMGNGIEQETKTRLGADMLDTKARHLLRGHALETERHKRAPEKRGYFSAFSFSLVWIAPLFHRSAESCSGVRIRGC